MAVAFVVVFSTFIGIQSFATFGASKEVSNEANDEETPIAETTIAVEETQLETSAARNPVILCHGFIGGYGLTPWGIMKDRLVRDGWNQDQIFEIYYKDPVFASNVQNAQELAAYVQNVLKLTGANKVDLIAHSMGGLSARYYIKFLGGVNYVDDYVSLGTPQHGTLLADIPLLPLLSAGAIEMRPGSTFLTKLNNGDETPGSVSYTSIYSYIDELVFPYTTCKLNDGAANKGCWSEHVYLVFHSGAYEWTRNAIVN
jgi:triacylglycerol lipase